MKFEIKEGKSIDYEKAKLAYLQGVRGTALRKMFGMGTSQYTRLLQRFREDGLTVPHKGNVAINKNPKYYHKNLCKGISYYTVTRTINWKRYYFGHFKTEAEAKARVMELEKNNWEGLIE